MAQITKEWKICEKYPLYPIYFKILKYICQECSSDVH